MTTNFQTDVEPAGAPPHSVQRFVTPPFHSVSLGAGVQSSTMDLMAEAEEIQPRPIVSIFADTKAEPANVIAWLDWLETKLTHPVKRVTAGSLESDCLEVRRSKKSGKIYTNNTIPAFALHPNGEKGLFGRRCTYNQKIEPIVKELRAMLGKLAMREWRKKHAAALKEIESARKDKEKTFPVVAWEECQADALVIQWIGISTDEAHRMKPNRQPWIRNRYPLVEKGMSRKACLNWMKARGYPEPPRSSCTFCPFHSDEEWKALSPSDFEAAATFEEKLQTAVAKSEVTNCIPYLHASCVPLRKVKFAARNPYEQVSLFGNECEGMCGV